MKISHNWLQTFFDKPLPPASELDTLLTFHSSEVEEVIMVGDDSVLDVKVLPDKSSWLLSHRGVVKEISVITGQTLSRDPFNDVTELTPTTDLVSIVLDTPTCDLYSAALITNITVGPSPEWLKARLTAIGQRSINNVVDATNYIMFELGQPLHAFDAGKLGQINGTYQVGVRNARPEETITTLTGESYTLDAEDAIIIDRTTDTPIGIAGIKGGQKAAVDASTTSILIEAAHFERGAIRSSSKRLRLATDASKRYENGISKGVAPIALDSAVKLISEVAGGQLMGYQTVGDRLVARMPVSCELVRMRSVLGLDLSVIEIETIVQRFGYDYTLTEDLLTIVPPFERDDLVIAEDVIEEIGRMYGLDHIVSIPPTLGPVAAYNSRHYYAEIIRTTLTELGFSEVFTSSFRSQDIVRIKNALASDKSYLRSSLHDNLRDAIVKNVPNRDLLGLSAVKIFEIGTIFKQEGEAFHVGLGVQTGTGYKAKVDDPLLTEAQTALATSLSTPLMWLSTESGVSEFSLDEVLLVLPRPTGYAVVAPLPLVPYQPFSLYPSVSRDIALWVPITVTAEEVEKVLRSAAGNLCVRVTLFDTFIKEDRTSFAFRLVFQSKEKTLDGLEVDSLMQTVYSAVLGQMWESR